MNRAQKIKITVSTVEEIKGEDYAIKVKVRTERFEEFKKLTDSTIDYYEGGAQTWLTENRKKARYNAVQGAIKDYSLVSWEKVEEKEEIDPPEDWTDRGGNVHSAKTAEKPEKKDKKDKKDKKPKKEKDLKLVELRAKYPDIKATSKQEFLKKIAEARAAVLAAKKAADEEKKEGNSEKPA